MQLSLDWVAVLQEVIVEATGPVEEAGAEVMVDTIEEATDEETAEEPADDEPTEEEAETVDEASELPETVEETPVRAEDTGTEAPEEVD